MATQTKALRILLWQPREDGYLFKFSSADPYDTGS